MELNFDEKMFLRDAVYTRLVRVNRMLDVFDDLDLISDYLREKRVLENLYEKLL